MHAHMLKASNKACIVLLAFLAFLIHPSEAFWGPVSLFPFQSPCIPPPSTGHPHLLFTACNDHNLHAIYKGNFTKSWSRNLAGRLQTSPTLLEADLLIGTEGGQLYRLTQASGDIVWTTQLDGGYIMASPLLVANDYVIAAAGSVLYLVEASSGETLAAYAHTADISANIAFQDGLLAVPSIDGTVAMLRFLGEDGFESVWSKSMKGQIDFQSPPLFLPSALKGLIVGGFSNTLRFLDVEQGDIKWEVARDDVVASPSLLEGGKECVVGSSDGSVSRLHTLSGNVVWRTKVGVPIQTAPLLVESAYQEKHGGLVVVGTSGKGLFVFSLRTGEQLTTFKHETSKRSWILGQPQTMRVENEDTGHGEGPLVIVYTTTDGYLVSVHLEEETHRHDEL